MEALLQTMGCLDLAVPGSLGRRELDFSVARADRDDIASVLAGDQDAYEGLLRRYERDVANWMWRFTRDPSVLEDLVQEVFIEAYTSLGSFKGKSQFRTWLLTIATRVGYKHWKTRARDRKRDTEIGEWLQLARDEECDPTPKDAADALHQILATLPPGDRLVLTLMYFEELSVKEIQELTGWSGSLVKVRAFRARNKLKPLLEKQGFGGD